MAAAEDFSFPATAAPDLFFESPPLWRVPSDSDTPKLQSEKRKRFPGCATAAALCLEEGRGQEDGGEKMDMLWEDLNEDLSSSRRRKKPAQPDAVVKAGGAAASSPGFAVFLKALKKLFVARHSHHHQRRINRPA